MSKTKESSNRPHPGPQSGVTAMQAAEPTLLLDLKRSAAMAGLTVWQMRGLIARKEIMPVWIGDKLYIARKTLIRWVECAEEAA